VNPGDDDQREGLADLASRIRAGLPNQGGSVSALAPRSDPGAIPRALRLLAAEIEEEPALADTVLVVLSSPHYAQPRLRVLGRDLRSAECDGLLFQAAMLPPLP
jgi:hypothetical protein